MRFAYHKTAPGDTAAAAIAATERIEVCRVKNGVTVQCPGIADWVLYDKNDPAKQIPASAVFQSAADAKPLKAMYSDLPVDWDDPLQANDFFIVHVSNVPLNYFSEAFTYGFCANWSRLAQSAIPTDDRFHIHGVSSQKQLFGTLDPCTEATKSDWPSGGVPVDTYCGQTAPFPPRNGCLGAGLPEWTRQVMLSEDEAQFGRIQLGLQPGDRKRAWKNGVLGGTTQPTRVLAGPHRGSAGNAGYGVFYLNIDTFHPVKPALDPVSAMATPCGQYSLSLATHEYFHQLEIAWARDHQGFQAHIDGLLHESMPASVELNLCLEGFPNADQLKALGDPRWECVSAGKVGQAYAGVYNGKDLLGAPQLDALAQYYASALFMRYVQEQFSYPVPSGPHPAGGKTSVVLNSIPHGEPLSDRKSSDEGVDFFGHLFKAFGTTTGSTTSILDQTLKEFLGRDLDGVIRDFHTAMVLKDYVDTDPRWRFVWTNRDGYFAVNKLGDAKPFSVPSDFYGDTCGSGGCDGLTRARRVLDSWQKGPSLPSGGGLPPIRKLLGITDSISSAQPAGLGVRGAAFLSVSPQQPDWTGKTLAFRAEVPGSAAKPNLRVFRINETAPGQYEPEIVCGGAKQKACKFWNKGDGKAALNTGVLVKSNTVEVLAVASVGSTPTNFTWSFGALTPKLTVIEPTETSPAIGGSKPVPRKFAVKLSYRDQLNQPVAQAKLDKGDIEVYLHGCQVEIEGGTCKLPPQYVESFPISGGSLFLVAQVPQHFYPLATLSGTFDLEVRLVSDGVSATSPKSVSYGPQGLEAVVLALDRSPSMSFPPAKAAAAKLAAKALVRSFVPAAPLPTTLAGVVSFASDASTAFSAPGLRAVTAAEVPAFDTAIDSLTAPGIGTSIGDGLLESQSVLAATFDNNPDFKSAFERFSIVVLSDGLNTAGANPWQYYAEFPTTVFSDGNGPWFQGPLSRKHREQAGLTNPVVSAIAIGQDADISELDHLARTCKGTLTYVEGDSSQLMQATIEFSDALFESAGSSTRYQRTIGTPIGAGGVAPFSVEPGVRELSASLVSGIPGGGVAELRSPSGLVVAATAIDELGHSTSFRVTQPEPGTWTVSSLAVGHPSEPIAFVEAAVDSPFELFAQFDVDDVNPLSGATQPVAGELDAWQGEELTLRALMLGEAPLLACTATAVVTHPDGRRAAVELRDDGEHGDGDAADGLFGYVYARTARAGLYRAKIRTTCSLPDADFQVTRERSRSVTLRSLPDLNADGVPDRWAALHGLVVTPFSDADADALTDVEELDAGTNPSWSDSDEGGESDGSEVLAGRDPRDRSDDLIDAPAVVARAGDGAVFLPASLFVPGVALRAERAPAPNGPFSPIAAEGDADGTYLVDRAALNDQPACYRVRADRGAISSGWSPVSCVVPRRDPVAPRVRVAQAPALTHTRDVDIAVSFLDAPRVTDGAAPPVDIGGEASGVEAMRVWFGADRSGDDVPWQPATTTLALRLPDQDLTSVLVQVRDQAGNVGQPVVIGLRRPLRTSLERAIAAEERAEDQLEAGDLARAKVEIASSLPFVEESFQRALGILKHSKGDAHQAAVHAVLTLAQIRASKATAGVLLKPNTLHLAAAALQKALTLEVELATFADEKGLAL